MYFDINCSFDCIFCAHLSSFDYHGFYGTSPIHTNAAGNSGLDFCMAGEQRAEKFICGGIACFQHAFSFQHTAHTLRWNSRSRRVGLANSSFADY